MSETVIYAYPGACSRVTLSALEEAGVPYVDQWVDIRGNQQYSPEYIAQNRKAKVPTLSVDGKILTENPAILSYLHQIYPDAGLLPRSGDPYDDARGLSDLVWCSSMLHPMVRQIRNPQKWTKGDVDGIAEDGLEKLNKEAKFAEETLSISTWWYGEHWSIVDVYVYWVFSTAAKGAFNLEDYPSLTAHAERVRARPSFQRALAREQAAVAKHKLNMDASKL
ncbi:glutathione S-transferase family protein [Rhizobium sp. PAMB 3174]